MTPCVKTGKRTLKCYSVATRLLLELILFDSNSPHQIGLTSGLKTVKGPRLTSGHACIQKKSQLTDDSGIQDYRVELHGGACMYMLTFMWVLYKI